MTLEERLAKLEELNKKIITKERLENIAKSYVEPNSNYDIKDLAVSSKLLPSTMKTFIDLVVDQSEFLKSIKRVPINSLMHEVSIDKVNGKLIQIPEGTAPTTGATKVNAGYQIYVQSMQFYYMLTFEQMAGMKQIPSFETDTRMEMYKEFSNQLFRLAMFGSRVTSPDLHIKNGYNWITGTTYEDAPYTTVGGWLEFLRKGYDYTVAGSTVHVDCAGVVSTWDSVNSKWYNILDVLESLYKSFPSTYMTAETTIYLSYSDFQDFQIAMGYKNADTNKIENALINRFMGVPVKPVNMMKALNTIVTVSATPYYPGMAVMCNPKDLLLVEYMEGTYGEKVDVLERCMKSIIDVKVGFGAVPQRIAIAKRS